MSSLSSELRRRANKEFNKTTTIIIMIIIIITNVRYVRFVIPIKSSLRPQKHRKEKKNNDHQLYGAINNPNKTHYYTSDSL